MGWEWAAAAENEQKIFTSLSLPLSPFSSSHLLSQSLLTTSQAAKVLPLLILLPLPPPPLSGIPEAVGRSVPQPDPSNSDTTPGRRDCAVHTYERPTTYIVIITTLFLTAAKLLLTAKKIAVCVPRVPQGEGGGAAIPKNPIPIGYSPSRAHI